MSTGANGGRDRNGPLTQNFFSIGTQCGYSDNRIQDCGSIGTTNSCTCGNNCYGWLNCQPGTEKWTDFDVWGLYFSLLLACDNGETRLVGGSTNREGRVEVCVNGRWGTVCNKSQEGIAGAVCSQLGFAAQGISRNTFWIMYSNLFVYTEARVVTTFPSGFVPISRCTVQNGQLSCTQITDASCDHSMDLGVVCSTYEQLYNELLAKQTSTEAPSPTCPPCEATTCSTVTCPECPTMTSESCDSPTSSPCPEITCPACAEKSCPTIDCSTCQATTTSSQNRTGTIQTAGVQPRVEGCASTPVLGGAVGVLVTVLVVLVIGWSLSCVALVKRSTQTLKQTQWVQKKAVNKNMRTQLLVFQTLTCDTVMVLYSTQG